MEIVNLEERVITGISTRTSNEQEFNSNSAKIAKLYETFDKQVAVDYKNDARVYGVYYNYESDANGKYSVLAGTDKALKKENIEQVTLLSGQYMVFEAKGEMPSVVIKLWGEIWNYFSDVESEYRRVFTTDFEFYKSEKEIQIYIAIK